MPTVSVIMPVYNREKIILKTLGLLKEQKHRPLEIILIDDASSDNTVNLIKFFISKNLDKQLNIMLYLNKNNMGACYSRNKGMSNATGKYIQFLDSDDYIQSDKISIQLNEIKNKNVEIVISDYVYKKNGVIIKKCKNDGNLFRRISLGWSIYTSSPLFSSALIKKSVKWNEKLQMLQDKDFIFKALMLSGNYLYVSGYTSNYIQHDYNQISDLYSVKKPQFFNIISSRTIFLLSNFYKMTLKCNMYTFVGIVEIFFQFIKYYIKKILKFVFGNKIFNLIKKYCK